MSEEEPNYISLKKAAKYCQYSQEYLSLRARQGKLKATKIGRNWATTKEWVKEYEKKMEAYKKGEKYEKEQEKEVEKERKEKKEKKKPKKKQEKREKKKEPKKEFEKEKDHIISILTGILIGIIISTLVINFILFYKSLNLERGAENDIVDNPKEAGDKMLNLSYAANRVTFDDLKILKESVIKRERELKEGLAYSGGEIRKLITQNAYLLADGTTKRKKIVSNFLEGPDKENQLASVKVKRRQEEISLYGDKATTQVKGFIYSLAFYSNSLIDSSKKVSRENLLKASRKLDQVLTETDFDIHMNTVKFIASAESIHKTTNLFNEYSIWLKNNLIN